MTMSHTFYVVHQNINPHQWKKKCYKWHGNSVSDIDLQSQIKVWRAIKGVSFNKTRKKIKDSIDWLISKLK